MHVGKLYCFCVPFAFPAWLSCAKLIRGQNKVCLAYFFFDTITDVSIAYGALWCSVYVFVAVFACGCVFGVYLCMCGIVSSHQLLLLILRMDSWSWHDCP